MKVFLLNADIKRHRGLVPNLDSLAANALQRFNGTSIGESWRPLRVEVDNDYPEKLPPGDLASLYVSHVPVFSERAVETLRPLLSDNGEVLSLSCDCGDYFAFNVTTLVDGMDTQSSDVVYFDSGKIMNVKRYALRPERIGGAAIFKLPQVPLMDVFVTDQFVKLVKGADLTGFRFVPL